MPQRLTVESITSVGAVTDGDNPAAKIMLYKKHPDRDKPIEGTEMDLTKLGVTGDAKAAIEAEIAKLQARIDELEPADPEAIIKNADPKVAEEFAKQQAELAELRKQADETAQALEKERDERRTVELAKIADKYESVIGDNDNAVPMLKSMPDETVEWLTERLNHIASIMKQSPLFKEHGALADDDDPSGKLHALAIEKMGQNPDLTIEQARTLARTERPDLAAAERNA